MLHSDSTATIEIFKLTIRLSGEHAHSFTHAHGDFAIASHKARIFYRQRFGAV
jgi:hypothetical protein